MIFKKNPEHVIIDLFLSTFEARLAEVRVFEDRCKRVHKLQLAGMTIEIEYRYSTIQEGGPQRLTLTQGHDFSLETTAGKYRRRVAKFGAKRKKAIYYQRHLTQLKDLTSYINRTIGD